MKSPHVTLTIANLGHAGALTVSDEIGDQFDEQPVIAISETDETAGLWNVVVYCPATDQAVELYQILLGRGYAPETLEISSVPDVDWVRNSLAGLPPVIAGRFFLHGSHHRERRRSGGLSFEIGAGTAFGTGHHGTTAGCLLALDSLLKRHRPAKILDVGCGTGILAIASARALRRHAVASDIDPEAIEVTKLNARINGAAPLVTAICAAGLKSPKIRQAAPYDLAFANILARPLLALAPGLSAILAKGGHLILSGITLDQIRIVRAAYRNRGLFPVRTLRIGNWATLVLQK